MDVSAIPEGKPSYEVRARNERALSNESDLFGLVFRQCAPA
jgi:hypothetical protein